MVIQSNALGNWGTERIFFLFFLGGDLRYITYKCPSRVLDFRFMRPTGQTSHFHSDLPHFPYVLVLSDGHGGRETTWEIGVVQSWDSQRSKLLTWNLGTDFPPPWPVAFSKALPVGWGWRVGYLVDPLLLYERAESCWVPQFYQCREVGSPLLGPWKSVGLWNSLLLAF